jgi:hypothetical protein
MSDDLERIQDVFLDTCIRTQDIRIQNIRISISRIYVYPYPRYILDTLQVIGHACTYTYVVT